MTNDDLYDQRYWIPASEELKKERLDRARKEFADLVDTYNKHKTIDTLHTIGQWLMTDGYRLQSEYKQACILFMQLVDSPDRNVE